MKGWVRVRLSVRTVCERRGSACRYDCTFLIGGVYRSYTLLVIGHKLGDKSKMARS